MAAKWRRNLGRLVQSAALVAIAGCLHGGSQNPSYFPYLLPTGDIVRTHAKPPGRGYFANFDPHAVRIEVRPLRATSPVRTQYLLVATVYDEDGQPRRKRRVEWMLEGVGNIVEVDESGFLNGRGYKVDNRYAVSYTDYLTHTVTRGNDNPADDFTIYPGQTWCIITSATEGDTHVTVMAPEVHNWDKREVVATVHWVDTGWTFPETVSANAGGQAELTTNLFRHSDKRPVANYGVRYRLIDGPAAAFSGTNTAEATTVTDPAGRATVAVRQLGMQPGTNRVEIQVFRTDPENPTGPGIVIARQETNIEWQAAELDVKVSSPPTALIDQDILTTINVTNPGRAETQPGGLRMPMPPGAQVVQTDPPAQVENGYLIWSLPSLAAGRQQQYRVTFRAGRSGTIASTAQAYTAGGLRSESQFAIRVDTSRVKLELTGPTTAIAGQTLSYMIGVTNPGTGAARGVRLKATLGAGLEHATGQNPLWLTVGELLPGQSRRAELSLAAKQVGRFTIRVEATGEDNLTDFAEIPVEVRRSPLEISMQGPNQRFMGRDGTWRVNIQNTGDVPVAGVVVRNQLPPELMVRNMSNGGQMGASNDVVWQIGTIRPNETQTVAFTANATRYNPKTIIRAVASTEDGLEQRREMPVEILGTAALRIEVIGDANPVESGGRFGYVIRVTNRGTMAADQVEVAAMSLTPAQLAIVGGRGPTAPRRDGDRLTFPPINNLQPGQVVSYRVEAQSKEPGDARFHSILKAPTLNDPLIAEEATRVVPRISRQAGR
jgi:uncharacterized repeat protein (TIGR01451 family)